MPEWPRLTKEEFAYALDLYLDAVEEQAKESGQFASTLWGGWNPLVQTAAEYTDDLKDTYMSLVDAQGVGPWLPNYAEILRIGAPERYEFIQEQQKQTGIEDWQQDYEKWQAGALKAWDIYARQAAEQQQGALKRWELRLAEQEMGERRKQSEQERALQLRQLEQETLNVRAGREAAASQERAAQMWGFMQGSPERQRWEAEQAIKPEMAKTYEEWRGRLLSELSQPMDWITKWQVQNAPNPYKTEPTTSADNIALLSDDVKQAKAAADMVKERMKDPSDPLTPSSVANPRTTEEQMANTALQNYDIARHKLLEAQISFGQSAEGAAARGVPMAMGGLEFGGGGMPQKPRPTTPPAPAWLTPFTGLQAGQPIEPVPLATPSGQAWQRLPPSQQQGLLGFGKWAGQEPADVIQQMQVMLPRTPSVASRWSPARQFA